jgi:oxygen-dependent protoporphyrinogen oxidase
MKKVVIVGGGISGLSAAYHLHQRGQGAVDYTLIESAPTFGGMIATVRADDFVVEGGPDSFLTAKPAALELCRALGLGDQLIGTNDRGRKIFVWSRGKLREMPDGLMLIAPTKFLPFVTSSLISLPGKLRMGMEALIPRRGGDGDESLAQFVRRRLGREALERIAEPMIAGIYVADAERLSLQSTFPRFHDMEQKHGSVIRGSLYARRAASGQMNGAVPMFMTLRGGLQQLTETIVARLDRGALLANTRVDAVARDGGGYTLALNNGASIRADEVVFATPAYTTAALVRGIAPALAASLEAIRYVSTATVSLGYRRADLLHPLDGFGFVVPRSENRRIIACTWSSTKFDHRADRGHALVRAFIGGSQAEHLAELDEGTIADIARDELRALMGIAAPPVLTRVYRWHKANPQYDVGHQARVARLEDLAASTRGLHLIGSAYRGVGLPDCIADGARVAGKILAMGDIQPRS